MGLTLGVVAAPCLGPFILGLLTYVGQKGDPFLGFLYFFVLSIGMGLPLSVLAIFSGNIDRLPRSGDWMVWIKKVMGWVLLGMAMYMISPLIRSYTVKTVLPAIIFIMAGIHLGWMDKTGKTFRGFKCLKRVAGILAVISGLLYLVSSGISREQIRWVEYDEAVIAKAAKDGVPLILDFYADWCLPCKEMDKVIFSDSEIIRMSRDLIVMRLDLTQRREDQDELLSRYNVRGVPTVIFINRHGIEEEKSRVESLVSRNDFLTRMKNLFE
jgi:thiol:disulfide interchange protein DsbD